jgi:DNA-binding NarL/FixJ family response regulator
MAVRVLVVEDNQLMRIGIVSLLRSQGDVEVVGEACDGVEAINRYRALRPDVVLLDLRMPTLDGVQVATALLREDPGARLLVLTHYDGDEQIFQAMRAGARGYLTKESPGGEVLAAVRAVHAGLRYLPPAIAARLAARDEVHVLTARERQVLAAMAEGLANQDIAARLGVSVRTVAIFVRNVLWKLDAKSRTEAVAVARRRGLVNAL